MLATFQKIRAALDFFREAFLKQRLKLAVLTAIGFISGLLGGLGIGAIIPLFSFIVNKEAGNDAISKLFKSIFSIIGLNLNIYVLVGFIIIIFIIKAILLYAGNYINVSISSKYLKEVRIELLESTLDANWPYLSDQKLGFLSTLITGDAGACASSLGNFSSIILIATSLIMYGTVAINISPDITMITIGVGIILFFVQKPILFRTRKLSQFLSYKIKVLVHFINENVLGAKTIKIMAAEEAVLKKSTEYLEELRELTLKQSQYGIIFGTLIEPITIIFVMSVFVFSYSRPDFNIITFAAILYLIQKMFSFMQSAQSKLNDINDLLPYMRNVMNYRKSAIYQKEVDKGSAKFSFNNILEFKNISFSYNNRNAVLTDLNFSIKAGQTVGLIGSSGVGKTTTVDLLLRLWEPETGQILLDNRDIKNISLKEWRHNIGYVSQDIFLINDTIENNIKFYSNIADKDIVEAAKKANVYDFIINSPDKFHTLVGERGIKLSGGQRQRIILARILARKPKFLILDEATSSVDNESENKIHNAIENLKGKVTIFIIAHRLSTVMNSDKLLVLNNGKIVEEGLPHELLKNKDSYFYKNYNIDKN